jgi:hypothetical protein
MGSEYFPPRASTCHLWTQDIERGRQSARALGETQARETQDIV